MSFLRRFVEVFEDIESVFVGNSARDAAKKRSQLGQTVGMRVGEKSFDTSFKMRNISFLS